MRPKKKVLLFCGDEGELGRLRFVLTVRGYRVTGTDSLPMFELDLRHEDVGLPPQFDLAAVAYSARGYRASTRAAEILMAQLGEEGRTLTLVGEGMPPEGHRATIVKRACDVSAVLDAVRLLCQGKRWPKAALAKKPPQGVPAPGTEMGAWHG